MSKKERATSNKTISMKETGKNLKAMAEKRGLTAEDIRESLNLASRQAVYRWYRGETIPSLENLRRLEDILEASRMDDLVVFIEPNEIHE